MLKNDKMLTLSADTFSSMKDDFDSILNRTLGNMEMKGAEEATVTLKLGIKLDKTTIYDNAGAHDVIEPSFKHDISSVMQVKDKKSGQLAKEMALVYDKDTGKYILRPFYDGQMSFDEEGTIYNGDGEVLDSEELELPFGEPLAIEDKSESQDKDVFLFLKDFVGKELVVTESNGNYAVRDDEETLILSSSLSKDNPFYIDSDVLKDIVGEVLVVVGYVNKDGDVENIAIECPGTSSVIFEISAE